MKHSIMARFAIILFFGLAVCSLISSFFLGRNMLNEKVDSMTKTILVVDYLLDYDASLQEQIRNLQQKALQEGTRVTVIDKAGNVLADSGLEDVTVLDNHMGRDEVKEALETGEGYSTRYSASLNMRLIYVARLTANGEYVVRMAVPYTNLFDYMQILFLILLVSMIVAFLVSMGAAVHVSNRLESEDIKRQMEQMEKEKKIRQEFFSNASHELKTPITSVRGYAELLTQDFARDEVTRQDFLNRILKETEHMATLIDDILMISRLESKDTEVTLSKVNLKSVAESILQSLAPQAAKCNVNLQIDCKEVSLQASVQQMRELMLNLVSNGIKYNQPGGYVRLRIWQDNAAVWIEVKDNGCGIAPEDQERIFERFYRVDKGRSRKMGGTGLGLSIVKHIAAYYGGQVRLTSELGRGSCFTVEIPRSGINKE